jgi:hypothetical protein
MPDPIDAPEPAADTPDPPWTNLSDYRRYLEEGLCWVDGTPTHLSYGTQRQCPLCRVKWSYTHKQARFKALMAFCSGSNATEIARNVGCAKNTARAYFHDFSQKMEIIIAEAILADRIGMRPTCEREARALECALRTGHRRARTQACRHLFFHSLNIEERTDALFLRTLLPEIHDHVAHLQKKAKQSEPTIFYASCKTDGRMPPSRPPRKSLTTIFGERIRRMLAEFRARRDPSSPNPSRACEKQGSLWVRTWFALRPPGSLQPNTDKVPYYETDSRRIHIPEDPLPIDYKPPPRPSKLDMSADLLRELISESMGWLRASGYPEPGTKKRMSVVSVMLVDQPDFLDDIEGAPEVSPQALYRIFANRFDLPELTPEQEQEMREREQASFERDMHAKPLLVYWKWLYARWLERRQKARSARK